MASFRSLLFLLAPACHASVLLSTGASFTNTSSTTFVGSTSTSLGTGVLSSSSTSAQLGTGISSSSTTIISDASSSSSTLAPSDTGVSTISTGASSNTSPDPTPVSSPTPTVTVPTTTVTGTAETSAAIQIGPLLLYVWQNRGWINDDNNKQNYIDDVQSVNNNINNLLKDLPDPRSPPSQCGSTSVTKRGLDTPGLQKRSIISGILDELADVATAISCAAEISGNLANAAQSATIDSAEIATLTDALKDISDKLAEDQDDDQISTSQTSSSTSQFSCTVSTAVPSCVETFELSTLVNSASGTVSSTVTTLTTTSCTTITACSATATTDFTTISTTTSSAVADYTPCAYQCLQSAACGYPSASATAAARKRAALPTPDSASSFAKREIPALVGNAFAKRTLTATASIPNNADYLNQKAQGDGELDWGFIQYQAVSADFAFDGTNALNKWMQGVRGCTAIAIVSQKGFWWSHLMEPGFIGGSDLYNQNWDSITNALTNGDAKVTAPSSLAAPGGILEPTDDNPVTIYVFSPSAAEQFDDDWEPLPTTGKYQAKIDTLMGLLKNGDSAPFPNAEESITYYEWPNESVASQAVGKLVFEYDPEGTTDSTCQAVYRLWRNDSPTEVHFTSSNANAKAKRQACSISSSASLTTSASTTDASTTDATTTDATTTDASTTDASPTSAAPSTDASSSPTPTTFSTVTSSSAPASSTSDPISTYPYSPVGSQGPNQNNRCHVHVWEYDLTTEADAFVAQIQLWDAAGNEMLAMTDEEAIDGDSGHTWDCALQQGIRLTSNAGKDTVMFQTNVDVFDSTADELDFWCNTGDWATVTSDEKERQMDCYFHCPWLYANGTAYPAADTLHNP